MTKTDEYVASLTDEQLRTLAADDSPNSSFADLPVQARCELVRREAGQ